MKPEERFVTNILDFIGLLQEIQTDSTKNAIYNVIITFIKSMTAKVIVDKFIDIISEYFRDVLLDTRQFCTYKADKLFSQFMSQPVGLNDIFLSPDVPEDDKVAIEEYSRSFIRIINSYLQSNSSEHPEIDRSILARWVEESKKQ
jgi:hypothetical protein